jgi:hypothetical protein
LVTDTLPVNPLCHCDPTVYATWQPAAAAWATTIVAIPAAPTVTAAAAAISGPRNRRLSITVSHERNIGLWHRIEAGSVPWFVDHLAAPSVRRAVGDPPLPRQRRARRGTHPGARPRGPVFIGDHPPERHGIW